ncbi:MAG: peptidase, partial [Xanthobacteraceae bacterium]
MLIEAVRLTLFPAMMAFAASSDLLTMTIANRVSLILVAGFAALALLSGLGGAEVLSHV